MDETLKEIFDMFAPEIRERGYKLYQSGKFGWVKDGSLPKKGGTYICQIEKGTGDIKSYAASYVVFTPELGWCDGLWKNDKVIAWIPA